MEAPWVQLREDSHGIPMVIPMGIPTEILWEWDGNGNGNSIPTATLVFTPGSYSGIYSIAKPNKKLVFRWISIF